MNQLKDVKIDDKEFVKIEAIICSMTTAEKKRCKNFKWKQKTTYSTRKWNISTRNKQIYKII